MSDTRRAAEMERLLQLLMHDLRSPLGVAQGYVSLLSGQQLSSDDRSRALRGITDAVARISKLVDDVSTLLSQEEAGFGPGIIEASILCERVAADAGRRGVNVVPRTPCGPMKVHVGTSVDSLAEAITVVLSPSERNYRATRPPLTLGMSQEAGTLRFLITDGSTGENRAGGLVEFDPESISSVEHLRAHRHISLLQGQVWREVGQTRACGVTLPLRP